MARDQIKKYIFPVLPVKDLVIFPGMVIGISIKNKRGKLAAESSYKGNQKILILTEKENIGDEVSGKNLYKAGTVGEIRQFLKINGDIKFLVEGMYRAKVISFIGKDDPYIKAEATRVVERFNNEEETIALKNNFSKEFRKVIDHGKTFPVEILISVLTADDPNKLIDLVIPYMDAKKNEKQEILGEDNTKERLKMALSILSHNLALAKLEEKIALKTKDELSKMQKEMFLKEQLKTIQKELGEKESDDFEDLDNKINQSGMPEDVRNRAQKELNRLKIMPSFSPEISYLRNYIDWLITLPWSRKTESIIDIKRAQEILDEDHYGLNKVKERIIEYLAVQNLAGKVKGPILIFVGPPGTGKTSIGQSIARATNRKFTRMSLGGIRDEAEIRGHRRTYIGAMPGRIIQNIKNINVKNPVFMLDEIDKVGVDFRGDPSAALLEALDSEQNHQFSDHYLEVPFDLSDVFFITTANILDTIPPALKDRMEVISFPGYTEEEKFHIASKFLFEKQKKINGLGKIKLGIKDSALRMVISEYTREAGVRELERSLASMLRKIARKISENKKHPLIIDNIFVRQCLGPEKYLPVTLEDKDMIGSTYALAVTPAGGQLLSIEAAIMPGKGKLLLTGQLGEVMKESAQAALSYIRSELSKKENSVLFANKDIHIHIPEGAISKDGPSAGISIATSLYSLLMRRPVRKDIGMTGEITLRGLVLRVGGIKEKVLAASRAGIKEIILPDKNRADLEDIPPEVKKKIKFKFVKNIETVFRIAFK